MTVYFRLFAGLTSLASNLNLVHFWSSGPGGTFGSSFNIVPATVSASLAGGPVAVASAGRRRRLSQRNWVHRHLTGPTIATIPRSPA